MTNTSYFACVHSNKQLWGPDISPDEDHSLECCRPLKVQVFRLNEKETILANWKSPEIAGKAYHGAHGLRVKEWA